MSKFACLCTAAGFLCVGTVIWPAVGAEEGGTDGLSLRNFPTYWVQDRVQQDDFLPPPSGPGPVVSELGHPYYANGSGKQQTSRIADLANPILKPWVIEQMAKPNT